MRKIFHIFFSKDWKILYINYLLIKKILPKKRGNKTFFLFISFVFLFNWITLFLEESLILITNSKIFNILIFIDALNNPSHKEIKDSDNERDKTIEFTALETFKKGEKLELLAFFQKGVKRFNY